MRSNKYSTTPKFVCQGLKGLQF